MKLYEYLNFRNPKIRKKKSSKDDKDRTLWDEPAKKNSGVPYVDKGRVSPPITTGQGLTY